MADNPPPELAGVEGEVKWFDTKKGYGFIVGPEGQDIFVHYSVIEGSGFKALRDGATVEYDAQQTPKGWKATRVLRPEKVEVPRHNRSPRR